MAASKSYFARATNYRFLSSDRNVVPVTSDFEFDESEVWNNNNNAPSAARASSPLRISKKPARDRSVTAAAAASLPVNVPDWSKILKDEYRENKRRDDDDDFEGGDDVDDRIPPHEFIARQLARTRIASFSVHEGIGRTLKGRDLSRVRNAIFEKTGFQD
ncbi:protein S40-4-like [Lycium ferocissimum]|uniref:protein S40-4-like n=1 Tax=Lycium ferocissimum TaxID=112874 RepID=UPI002814B58E|nr:protein S40-4-like [Lycium ferocissimum]